jgi:cell division septum initiation protein DivIVA
MAAERPDFPIAMRGYERAAVDDYVKRLSDLVAQLEANQTREGVVKAALEQVGEETSAILQRAHETADEIASRSRSQAAGRVQQAEEEAQQIVSQAEERARRLEADTLNLWDERGRLIEDMRQLAEEVLGMADTAQERLEPPSEPTADADTVVVAEPTDELPDEPTQDPQRAEPEEPAA